MILVRGGASALAFGYRPTLAILWGHTNKLSILDICLKSNQLLLFSASGHLHAHGISKVVGVLNIHLSLLLNNSPHETISFMEDHFFGGATEQHGSSSSN